MKFKKLIVTVFLIFTASITFAADNISPSTRLEALLKNTKTFEANFSQITISEDNKVLKQSSGVAQFKRPGFFRWETKSPSHQIVITNNHWLWIYDVDLKQVTKQKVNNKMLTPASVLSGDTQSLLKQFSVTVSESDTRAQFVLAAKNKDANFKQIMIYFVDNKLSGLTVVDQMGQRNRFSFSDIKVNISLSPTLFVFTAPRGVDVLQSQ